LAERINYSSLNKINLLKEQKKRDIIFKNIQNKMKSNKYNDECIQDMISDLFNFMNRFYRCSIGMFRGLAEVYEFNTNFSRILSRNYGEEMPKYIAKAMIYFCDIKEGKEVFKD